jgi:hypothetical protein
MTDGTYHPKVGEVDESSMAPILQGMKAGQHQNWKDKCQSQNGIAVLFARMVIDI